MKNYSVPEQTLSEILTYLATKPYAEVYKIVPKLQIPQVTEIVEEVKQD